MPGKAGLPGTTAERRTHWMGSLPGMRLRQSWASLAATVLLLALSLLAPADAQLTEEEQAKLVEAHNTYRGEVQPSASYMLPLRWDDNLRILAESYAVKCIWSHNPDLEDLNTGENLHTATGPLNLDKAMDAWFTEYHDYHYHNDTCNDDKMCGHYTQMVWATSQSIGCAVHRCETLEGLDGFEKANLLVCNYAPAGNYAGEQPYEEGEPCSKCPEDHPRCLNNLCLPEIQPSEEPETGDEEEEEEEHPGTPHPPEDPAEDSAVPSGPPDTPDTPLPGSPGPSNPSDSAKTPDLTIIRIDIFDLDGLERIFPSLTSTPGGKEEKVNREEKIEREEKVEREERVEREEEEVMEGEPGHGEDTRTINANVPMASMAPASCTTPTLLLTGLIILLSLLV